MTVGERIQLSRKRMGMSQVDFAAKINVSKQTLYKYENNLITNIPSDKIEAVANLCHVTPAYLMGWTDSQQSREPKPTEGYYDDPEAAEFAEYLRTRPGARMLFSAAKDMSKEDMEKAVEYIELLKLKHK